MKTHVVTAIAIYSLLSSATASAVVVADGTLGTSVNHSGNNYAITAGTLKGSNIFHSLSQLNLLQGEIATFSGPAGTANIISRITGGPSSIDGTVRSTISGANLYLLNPAGILFGSNASLDVSGSFHASTADYLQFGQDRFHADSQMPVPVTISTPNPTAFGFLKPNPAAITVNGALLTVPQGKSISLVSGGINISDANLWASGGTINLVSVASPGEVAFNGVSVTPQGFTALGPVAITEGRDFLNQPDYSGAYGMYGRTANLDASGQGGGKILIRGGSFYMTGGTIYNDTYGNIAPGRVDINVNGDVNIARSNVTGAAMSGNQSGAAIAITGTNILITDGTQINTVSFTSANGSNISLQASDNLTLNGTATSVMTETYGDGKAGDLMIEAPAILIDRGSWASSSAAQIGVGPTAAAGAITVHAERSLTVAGGIYSDNISGNAGSISIRTGDLSIAGNGLVSTSLLSNPTITPRSSGDIAITANNVRMSGDGSIESRAFYSTSGSSGSITINTGNLTLLERSAISANIDSLSGTGGHINVTASGDILVSSNPLNLLREKGSISSDSTAGDAGNIRLEANNITVNNGATLSTVAQGGTGKGGNITLITHGSLKVEGSGSSIQTDTLAAGAAGTIELSAPQILVMNGGRVSSASQPGSTGAAGNISISADNLLVVQNSFITTQSAASRGGNITILAPVLMKVTQGEITASATGGYDNGGNVTIDAGDLTLNNGRITAQAEWGDGGNLLINVSKMFIKSADSLLSASSRYGQQGTVVVKAPNTDVTGALATPEFDILNLNAFIPKRCMAADELNSSTFRLLGSSGLPAGPESSFPIF